MKVLRFYLLVFGYSWAVCMVGILFFNQPGTSNLLGEMFTLSIDDEMIKTVLTILVALILFWEQILSEKKKRSLLLCQTG